MTIPMDKTLHRSSKERVQHLYNKNVELENRIKQAAPTKIPSDPNTWQQMRENYEAIILEDHAFSDHHDIEYALWQLHYRQVEELRAHYSAALSSASQNGKGTIRSGPDRVARIRSQLKTFLSEATGFYHDFMVKIRAKYGLPLGYFSDDSEKKNDFSKIGNKNVEVKKGLISCNRCLIYLGDLARYKGLYGEGDSKAREFSASSSYYMQASLLWPSSGNPHHQLAILASYSGDDLVAVYRYFRSLAAESPFSTARENLIITFEKNRHSYSQLAGDVKESSMKTKQMRSSGRGKGESKHPKSYVKVEAAPVKGKSCCSPDTLKTFSIRFVCLIGILFTRTSLETFEEVFSLTKSDFLELLNFGRDEGLNFGFDASKCRLLMIRMIAILIFTVQNVNSETENQSYAETLQRSIVIKNAFTATFEFMGHIMERCIQLSDASGSYLLPGIMVFVEWLACHQDIAVGSKLEDRQANARSFFWKHCVSFFNKLLSNGLAYQDEEDETCFSNTSRYNEDETFNRLALPEDFELRGFLPLLPAQMILNFSSNQNDSGIKETMTRIERIIAAGKALADMLQVGQQGIYYDTKMRKFAVDFKPQTVENSKINQIGEENSVGSETTLSFVLQPKVQFCVDGDNEDEVIVFKPSVSKKHDEFSNLNLSSSKVIPSVEISNVNLGNGVAYGPASTDGFIPQSSFNGSSKSHSSLPNDTARYLQPLHPSSLNSLAEERDSFLNGFTNFNLLETGFTSKPELQDYSGHLHPAAFTVPFPQSISLGAVNRYPVQAPETVIPCERDSGMSSGDSAGTVFLKSSAAGLKKNPVSRPMRYLGPPPGFTLIPPKSVDEPLSGITLKRTQLMDSYSLLDGYQLPASAEAIDLNNSINHAMQAYHSVSRSDNPEGVVSFPFPRKQVSTSQSLMGNQNGWQAHQFSGNLEPFEELHQCPQKSNQQSVELGQQFQGS